MSENIKFIKDGGIVLGRNFTCDGFYWDEDDYESSPKYRIQTHAHEDHMAQFERSKRFQNKGIICTNPTKDLLVMKRKGNLSIFNGFITLENNEKKEIGNEILEVRDANHIIGTIQVKVTLSDGKSIGYSSDFYWPCDPIKVDELVVDSTYGDPKSIMKYNPADIEKQFVEIALAPNKTQIVMGHRGRIQYCLSNLLYGNCNKPIYATQNVRDTCKVYEKYGFPMPEIRKLEDETSIEEIEKIPSLVFMHSSEWRQFPWYNEYTKIILSAYMQRNQSGITEHSDGGFTIPITDHADFLGTLNYIKATGARIVYPYGNDGGNSIALARYINEEMEGVDAVILEPEDVRI